MPIPDVTVRWSVPVLKAGEYIPTGSVDAGEEIVLVYIGSSTCGWSNVPELPDVVRSLKVKMQARAQTEGMGFAAVGVARDAVVANGMEHLDKFGAFDEVMAGRGWANAGVQKYIYGEMAGLGATPQILVVSRRLGYETGHVTFNDEKVLIRKVGVDEIAGWAAEGAPLQSPLQVRGRDDRNIGRAAHEYRM